MTDKDSYGSDDDRDGQGFYDYEDTDTDAFYGEEVPKEEYLQDGTYYTDVVQEVKNRKKIGIIVIIVVAIAAIIGLGYLGKIYILDNPEDRTSEPTPTATAPEEEPVEEFDPEYTEPNKPTTELLTEDPTPTEGDVSAIVSDNNLQTSDGTNVSFSNAVVTPTGGECVTRKASDFCNIAEITLGDDPETADKPYYAYFLRDAVNSRFFEDPENFTEVEVNGVPASATMTITTLDGNATPVLTIIQSNGSGFMFTVSDNSSESLTELAAEINN